MESLIKREVSVSLTAHSSLIRQLILDGLEIATFRQTKYPNGREHRLENDAIYYRNMRQNGHTTALRTIYKSNSFQDVKVLSVFMDARLRDDAMSKIDMPQRSYFRSAKDIMKNPDCIRGLAVDVIILNDYISINHIKEGWDVVKQINEFIPQLKLVVFLG